MPSISPLAILLWNQRKIPSQWRLTMCAASIIGSSRLWVTQKIPLLQEGGGRLGGGLLVEVLEGQPDLIGARGLQMMGRQAVEHGFLAFRQVGGIAQPDVACA